MRILLEVLPVGYGALGWKVVEHSTMFARTSKTIYWSLTKKQAVTWAVEECHVLYNKGLNTRLHIKNRRGRIADERTYGFDPEETEG